MSWLNFGKKPSSDDRLKADEAISASCRAAIAHRRSHPMMIYWAKLRLASAEARLRDTRNRIAKEQREAEIKASFRPAYYDLAGSPYDPATKYPRKSPPAKLLASAYPPMPWEIQR